MPHDIPRRTALIGIGALGALGVAACGKAASTSSGDQTATTTGSSPPSKRQSRPSPAVVLASISDIDVGSSVRVNDPDGKPVILSRPSSGRVVGFSAVCTHQGCTVNPDGARLDCPCHGSSFNAMTGAVLSGPAQRALPAYDVTVVRGQVRPA